MEEGEIIIILPVIQPVLLLSPPPPGKIMTIFTLRLDYLKYYYYLPLLHVR
jgi:hypothetical protein